MPDIKIKRYADKENLKELVKYSKDTFANKNEINENYYTKEQVDTMLEGFSGGGGTDGDYYTKSEIDTKLTSYVTLNGVQTISGAKTFTGNISGISKNNSTEDANSLYPTAAGSKRTYYTTYANATKLANIPDAVGTTLESRTIRRNSNSDWTVEQICHNINGLYYRRGHNGTWGEWKTFAFTDDVDLSNYYTKEQIDTLLESGSGGTGGGSEVGDATIKINYGSTNLGSFTTNQSADAIVDIRPINKLIGENFYTKKQIDILLSKVIVNQQVLGGAIYNPDIDEYNNETEQTMKTVSAVVEPTSVNAYTIVENSDTVEEL